MSPNDISYLPRNAATMRQTDGCLQCPPEEPADQNRAINDPKGMWKLSGSQNIELSLGRSQYNDARNIVFVTDEGMAGWVEQHDFPTKGMAGCFQYPECVKPCRVCVLYGPPVATYRTRPCSPSIFRDPSSTIAPKQDAPEVVLEKFDGFVDRIHGDTAYVTLRSEHGDVLDGEYSAAELKKQRIGEGCWFRCRTVQVKDTVRVELEAVARRSLSKAAKQALDREIDELFQDGDLDGDY